MIRALLFLLAAPAQADTIVASRTIPANTVIAAADLTVKDIDIPRAATNIDELVGMETRVALYAGRPVNPADVGFPAVIQRNQIVQLVYQQGNLLIATEGRSLDRAGPGDSARIMNLSSRSTVTAKIGIDGVAYVGY